MRGPSRGVRTDSRGSSASVRPQPGASLAERGSCVKVASQRGMVSEAEEAVEGVATGTLEVAGENALKPLASTEIVSTSCRYEVGYATVAEAPRHNRATPLPPIACCKAVSLGNPATQSRPSPGTAWFVRAHEERPSCSAVIDHMFGERSTLADTAR